MRDVIGKTHNKTHNKSHRPDNMRQLLDKLYNLSLAVAGVFLVGIFVLMIAESLLRKWGAFVPGASELVAWFCAAAGFLALPATFKRGDMVRVSLLAERARPTLRRALMLSCLLLATVFSGFMLWAGLRYLHSGWRAGETTQGMLEVAVWIPQSSFVVGVALLLVAVVDEFFVVLRAPVQALELEKPPSVDDLGLH